MEKPSEEFLEAVVQDGSIMQQYGFCGKLIFATFENQECYDEGELESLRKKQEQDPNRYEERPIVVV